MSTSKTSILLSAVVGAVAALGTVVVVGNLNHRDEHITQTQADDRSKFTPSSKSVTAEILPGRVQALEREVARLRDERSERAERVEPPGTDAEAPDPQADRRRVEARFSELERQLLADPIDPSWSPMATESLQNHMTATAKTNGFVLVAAECRTALCRATLRWDTYEAALKTGMQLPEQAIPGLNCARSIFLEESSNPLEPYSASLFLDCREQRAGRAGAIPPVATTTGETP
jgi:hypothetical protein